jgi:hypothetical protein
MTMPYLSRAMINERRRQFWLEQSELLNIRICDTVLHDIAMRDIAMEEQRMVPVKNRKSLGQALADAENSRAIVQRAFARKGGKAAKGDTLQCLIVEIVRGESKITGWQLMHKLRKMAKDGHPVVFEVDQQSDVLCDEAAKIHFKDRGTSKTASISGLKDRLSRAKQKIFALAS